MNGSLPRNRKSPKFVHVSHVVSLRQVQLQQKKKEKSELKYTLLPSFFLRPHDVLPAGRHPARPSRETPEKSTYVETYENGSLAFGGEQKISSYCFCLWGMA